MNNDDHIAGAVMAALVGQIDEKGQSIADRVSVSDLWDVLSITIPVVRMSIAEEHGTPAMLKPEEAMAWADADVRTSIKEGRKIEAIKNVRAITKMGLKESKDFVEKMEKAWKDTGGWLW